MTTITLELPSDVYHRLHKEADRLGKLPQVVAQEWLIERLELPTSLTPSTGDDRERVRQVLQEAGLLTELGSNLRELADSSTASLQEVRASLDQVGGKPLSEIVLEQRGVKE